MHLFTLEIQGINGNKICQKSWITMWPNPYRRKNKGKPFQPSEELFLEIEKGTKIPTIPLPNPKRDWEAPYRMTYAEVQRPEEQLIIKELPASTGNDDRLALVLITNGSFYELTLQSDSVGEGTSEIARGETTLLLQMQPEGWANFPSKPQTDISGGFLHIQWTGGVLTTSIRPFV